MSAQVKIVGVGLLIAVVAYLALRPQQPLPFQAGTNAMPAKSADNSAANQSVAAGDRVASDGLHLRPEQVLATVNGHTITLRDVVPISGTNQEIEIAPGDLKYFLARAVDRELILETAKAQGVELDDSQRMQLGEFRAEHAGAEPGLMQRFNAEPSDYDLSQRDAEAFMLQTSLLARAGVSPDVNADEVQQYYNEHTSEFAGIPQENADYQIRTLLAPVERQNFQNQLATYMSKMRSGANITMAQSL